MSEAVVETALQDGALLVTLNREARLNAFNVEMMHALLEVAERIDDDDDVRAAIFTGAGRAFCAGADLQGGGGTFDRGAGKISRDGGGRVTTRFFDCRKPLIAAVNGAAVGVGATMLLPMDVRLASERARFGFVFARRGIVPEAASSWFLPRAVGISQAMEWVATGRIFDAEEARAGRLVSAVVPHEELLPRAFALAREISEHTSGAAVCLARQMMWKMLGAPHPMHAHNLDSRLLAQMGAAPDAYEGVQSFLEKRPARFTMSPARDLPAPFPWWQTPPFEPDA